jgi:hypothetical protein
MKLPSAIPENYLSASFDNLMHMDESGILGLKKDDLATLFALVEMSGFDFKDIVLFEMGAAQLDFFSYEPELFLYDGHISHFFAAHKNLGNSVKLPKYFAFDPEHSKSSVAKTFDWYKWGNKRKIKNYPVDCKLFVKNLQDLTIDSFSELNSKTIQAIDANKIPIYFSNHVFGYSANKRFPFWLTPKTLQIHQFNSTDLDRFYDETFLNSIYVNDSIEKSKIQLQKAFDVSQVITGYETKNRFWDDSEGELITLAWYNKPELKFIELY